MKYSEVSRREFLRAGGAAFIAATGMTVEAAMKQKGFRLRGSAPAAVGGGGVGDGTQPIVAPENLIFKGFIRLPTTPSDYDRAKTATLRQKDNGDLYCYLGATNSAGTSETLLESDITGVEPSLTMSSAPRLTHLTQWTDFIGDTTIGAGGRGFGNRTFTNLYWDPVGGHLWFQYSDTYTGSSYPNLGATIIDDAAHTVTSRGPWKFSNPGNKAFQGLLPIPEWFRTEHDGIGGFTSSMRLAHYGGQHSGNASAPFGASMYAFAPIDPLTYPVCTSAGDNSNLITSVALVHHDSTHQQARNTSAYACGFGDGNGPGVDGDGAYLFADGSTLSQCAGVFGVHAAADGIGECDSQRGLWWLNTTTRQGLVMAGHLAHNPASYADPTNSSLWTHCGYADPSAGAHGVAGTDKQCAHGYTDLYWFATGPFNMHRQPTLWLYDPNQFGEVLASTRQQYGCVPSTDEYWFGNLHSAFSTANIPNPTGALTLMVGFDDTRNYLFFMAGESLGIGGIDNSGAYGRPCLYVFEVN